MIDYKAKYNEIYKSYLDLLNKLMMHYPNNTTLQRARERLFAFRELLKIDQAIEEMEEKRDRELGEGQ